MAWNEPGGNGDNGKDRDPWGGGRKQQSRPDLDELFRKLNQRLGKLFSGKKGNGGNKFSAKGNAIGVSFIAVILLVVWGVSGIFIVAPAEQSVVLRLGHYLETLQPGPHWIPRFIDSETTLNVQKVSAFSYQAQMLTKDENIVSVALAVQYRVSNPKDYLYNVVNPRESLQQATASALRQVIGHTTLDNILTVGREEVRQQVSVQLQKIMDIYQAGLTVTDVTMQPAKAPEEVKAAFDDAIKAQEDEQRFINQAQAYKRGVEPIAEGKAKRIMQEAQAYQKGTVLQAQGDAARFLAILPEYQNAPGVTRERLYLDTVESVLSNTSKVLVDTKGSNNLMYLPLDKMIQSNMELNKSQNANSFASTSGSLSSASTQQSSSRDGRDYYRRGRK